MSDHPAPPLPPSPEGWEQEASNAVKLFEQDKHDMLGFRGLVLSAGSVHLLRQAVAAKAASDRQIADLKKGQATLMRALDASESQVAVLSAQVADAFAEVGRLSAQVEELKAKQRLFPIQLERGVKPHPTRIPWSVAEKAYSVYAARYGRDQSLERLAERGGFGPSEMDTYHLTWREESSEIFELRGAVERMTQEKAKEHDKWFAEARLFRELESALQQLRQAHEYLKNENEQLKTIAASLNDVIAGRVMPLAALRQSLTEQGPQQEDKK